MRHVLLTIDDERVTHVDVQQFVTTGPGNAHVPSGYHLVRSRVPVPSDDQLTRDLADVTAWILGYADEARDDTSKALIRHAAASAYRIRAVLGLDEGSYDE